MESQLFNYYTMIRNGMLTQTPNRPNGFESFSPRLPNSRGVVADRSWKWLTDVTPFWRKELDNDYESNQIKRLLAQGDLKPIVFSDVDFAVIDRDAQGHIDQYVVDRATLESLGFIAQYYSELRDPNIQLADIKGSSSAAQCFEIGQDLFHSSLQKLIDNAQGFIPISYAEELSGLIKKAPGDLTDEDFRSALENIEDAFYVLVVNPLGEFVQNQPTVGIDGQGGHDRMKLVYTTIAAFSHSQGDEVDDKIRHKTFAALDAKQHLYGGVEEFFGRARQANLEVVAITRGNQFPYMENSGSGLENIFDRVHSTLISSVRQSQHLDPLFPDKKIRSYSLAIDNMSSQDKVRIMIDETLRAFSNKSLEFRTAEELTNAVATYLDHCIFITDSDLDVWGTCPIVCVLALRSPTRKEIDELFGEIESLHNPIAIINPLDRQHPLLGLDSKDVFSDFEPHRTELGDLLNDMSRGSKLSERYSATGASHVVRQYGWAARDR